MLTRRNLLKGAAAGVPIAMGSVARWPTTALAQAGTKTPSARLVARRMVLEEGR